MRNASLARSKILIIDDEAEVVGILRRVLSKDGYEEIESTTDPFSAVRLFREFQPDLVVLDLMMPGLSGLKVLAELRAISPAEKLLPILVVTGVPTIEARREALSLGANDLVAKPYDTVEILARVENLLETLSLGRKKAEEAARESEERFFEAFEHAPIGVALVSPDRRWLAVNQALCEMLGYSDAELLDRNVLEVTHPGDLELTSENLRRAIAGEIHSFQVEKRYIHRSGHIITALANASLIRDGEGRPRHFICQIQDISERKRAEELLSRSRETLRGVLDHIPQRVFWKNLDLVYLGCNQAFALDMGFSCPGEVAGKTDYDASWKDIAELYRADDREVIGHHAAKRSFEEPGVGADGRPRWLRTTKTPLHDEQGRVTGVLGTYEDVTEHKLAKLEIERLNADLEKRVALRTKDLLAVTREAQDANRAKSEFLSRISHELRTPMNAILGFGQLLEKEENLGPEPRQSIEQILTAGRHLLALINKVLDISEADSDGAAFSLEPAEVAQSPVARPEQNGPASIPDPKSEAPRSRTLLYIEDNLSSLRLITRILARRPDIQMLSASTVALGLEMAREHLTDVILFDPCFPDTDAGEALAQLDADPRTSRIPVVILSAQALPGKCGPTPAAGERVFIAKPVDVRTLLGVLDELTGRGR